MSTYKIQPVYGELVLGWMDAACVEHVGFSVEDVLTAVEWRFKGGELSSIDPKTGNPYRWATPHSGAIFPDGMTADIAKESDESRNRRALHTILRIRRSERRRSSRALHDWVASYTYAASYLAIHREHPQQQIVTGLRAAYWVCRHVWNSARAMTDTVGWDMLMRYVSECTLAAAAGSHLHVPTCSKLADKLRENLSRTRIAGLTALRREFDRAFWLANSEERRTASRVRGRDIIDDSLRPYPGFTDDYPALIASVAGLRLEVMHGMACTSVYGHVVALSRSDMIRVHQFLMAAASGLYATVAQATVAPGPERLRTESIGAAYERQVDRLLASSLECASGREVNVCKAYKRAFSAYLGELSGPLCAAETQALWAEAAETPDVRLDDMLAWVDECRQWSAGTSFNIGKVYKLCPAPDASPAATLLERHAMVQSRNEADPEYVRKLSIVLRDQILRAYVASPGVRLELRDDANRPAWYGTYREGRIDTVPTREIHTYLRWEGTAQFPDRVAHDPAVWKDSGLGWDTVDLAFSPDRPQKHGNMLTRMVFDTDAPMPGIRHYDHAHHHKIDTKPEGHKDPARGIYSGNLADRENQSWMEAAVERVATHHPAFMIAASTAMREERIRAIVARNHDVRYQDFYYSFDIAGWSPKMDPVVQRVSHGIWGELYDEQLFRVAHAINEDAIIYMNKAGFQGWYINPGANLEGYNGKEMTMILVALLALAVQEWRAHIVSVRLATAVEADRWAAILLAYIDDGLAKLTLPRDRGEVLFQEFKRVTVQTFGGCGYAVEIAKCYPSDRFAIFLNEPYLGGRHVTHGTRAAMTICAENLETHTTVIERTTSVSTGCRGAVMAGLDALTGVFLQSYHTYLHIKEWVRRPDPVTSAVWSYMPRAWGGLGLPSVLQLGTSGGGAATEEGIQTMQMWAKLGGSPRKAFLTCARSMMADRSAMGIMLSPLGGRLESGPMIETRVPEVVREALARLQMGGRLSVLAHEFLSYSSPESMQEFASRVLSLDASVVIQEQLLADLSAAHPHAIFSSFSRRVEKSTTLLQLVGPRALQKMVKANKADARRSYAVLSARLL